MNLGLVLAALLLGGGRAVTATKSGYSFVYTGVATRPLVVRGSATNFAEINFRGSPVPWLDRAAGMRLNLGKPQGRNQRL